MLFNIIAGGTKELGAFGFCTRRFNLKQVRVYSRNDRNSRVTFTFHSAFLTSHADQNFPNNSAVSFGFCLTIR